MDNNTDAVMELGLAAMFWHFYSEALFYLEPLTDFLKEKGVPPSYLVCFVLGIWSTLGVTALCAFLRKQYSRRNRKYLGYGKIRFSKDALIGSGSTGSMVYQGKYETKDAAIKVIKLGPAKEYENFKDTFIHKDQRRSSDTETIGEEGLYRRRLEREVSINQAITLSNEFIVQYHGTEVYLMNKTVYLLIALELCKANLYDVVDMWNDFKSLDTRMVLRHLGKALYFLHGDKYVHRDLKPSNVLIKKFSHPDHWRVKLADFGATKAARFIQGRGHYSVSGDYGSGGWMAPETTQNVENKEGKSSGDIFSMGLIFFFVITRGNKMYDTQSDIQNNHPNEELFADASKEFPTEMDLITQMTHRDEKKRPCAADIKKHPALWDLQQIIQFTNTVNEVLPRLSVPELEKLEENHKCFEGNWKQDLTPKVSESMADRSVSFTSVNGLVHSIRNYGVHYSSQPRLIKREFGSFPDGYTKYWMKRFPGLLIHTYNVMKNNQRKGEALKKFY